MEDFIEVYVPGATSLLILIVATHYLWAYYRCGELATRLHCEVPECIGYAEGAGAKDGVRF